MIKLALTDLDDTLLPTGAASVSDRTMQTMGAARRAGVRVGPITGRQLFYMESLFPGHPECWATGGFCNGQVIYVDGRMVKTVALPREPLERIDAVLSEAGDAYLAPYDPWVSEECFIVTRHPERLVANPPKSWGKRFKRLYLELPDIDIYKANIQCACSHERMVELAAILNVCIPQLEFVVPGAHSRVIDVIPRFWNKAKAVEFIADHIGASIDEVAVFGDSDNDLQMINAVPNSVAVGNANDHVRDAARWHIGDCTAGAVADAYGQIAEAFPKGEMPEFMH